MGSVPRCCSWLPLVKGPPKAPQLKTVARLCFSMICPLRFSTLKFQILARQPKLYITLPDCAPHGTVSTTNCTKSETVIKNIAAVIETLNPLYCGILGGLMGDVLESKVLTAMEIRPTTDRLVLRTVNRKRACTSRDLRALNEPRATTLIPGGLPRAFLNPDRNVRLLHVNLKNK